MSTASTFLRGFTLAASGWMTLVFVPEIVSLCGAAARLRTGDLASLALISDCRVDGRRDYWL
jgi:hypothetical protein